MFGLFDWIENKFIAKYLGGAAAAAAAAVCALTIHAAGHTITWGSVGISISPDVLTAALTSAGTGAFAALSNWWKHRKDLAK